MSKVGLEVTNSINCDLNWKTVSKGNRSATRRSRKAVSRSLDACMEYTGKNHKNMDDILVSDSDKLGAADLGRRFGDRVGNLPIKKRKFLLQSPLSPSSPSQTRCPCPEDSKQPFDRQCASTRRSCLDLAPERPIMATDMFGYDINDGLFKKNIVVNDENLSYSGDFSGIEMLADVACKDSVGIGVENEGAGSAINEISKGNVIGFTSPGFPLEESAKPVNLFLTNLVHESEGKKLTIKDNDGISIASGSSRDDRSNWDLNTEMDAWGQPIPDQIVHLQTSESQCMPEGDNQIQDLENCEARDEHGDDLNAEDEDATDSMASGVLADVHGNNSLPLADHKFLACSGPERSDPQVKCVRSPALPSQKVSIVSCDEKGSSQVPSTDVCINQSDFHTTDDIVSTSITEENGMAEPSTTKINVKREDCSSGMQLNASTCFESVQVEKHAIIFSHASVLEKASCNINGVTRQEDQVFGGASNLFDKSDDKNSSRNMMEFDPLHAADHPTSVSNEVGTYSSEVSSAKGASIAKGSWPLLVNPDGSDGRLVNAPAQNNSQAQTESEIRVTDTSGPPSVTFGAHGGLALNGECRSHSYLGSQSGKSEAEDLFDDGYDSNISQDGAIHIDRTGKDAKRCKADDSQYEDGELIESVVHCWEENETEDGEAEHVDYESDTGGMASFGVADFDSMSEKNEGRNENPRLSSADRFEFVGEQNVVQNCDMRTSSTDVNKAELTRNNSPGMELTMQLVDKDNGRSCTEEFTESALDRPGSCSKGGGPADSSRSVSSNMKISGWDQLPKKPGGVNASGVGVPRRSKELLTSCIEVPSPPDGRGAFLAKCSRYDKFDDSYPAIEKESCSGKIIGRGNRPPFDLRFRSQGGDRFGDDYWSPKRDHSFRYYGPYEPEDTGPKRVFLNSRGMYRRPFRGPPMGRGDSYGMHADFGPDVDARSYGSRGRARRFSQGPVRGFRDGYDEFVHDGAPKSVRMPHYLSRRKQNYSYNPNRVFPQSSQSCRVSRSRSRTRSPPARLPSRERDAGFWRFSRSPDSRCENGTERTRVPFHNHIFSPDRDDRESDIFPSRSRFGDRWNDNQDWPVFPFRNRRSPVRMFQERQGLGSYRGGPNGDNSLGPLMRRGRCPESNVGFKGQRYKGGGHDGRRYEMSHPMDYDERDGVLRRLRDYDAEDGFLVVSGRDKDDCDRGGIGRRFRDMRWRNREESGHHRGFHGRVIRDYDDNAAPRNGGHHD